MRVVSINGTTIASLGGKGLVNRNSESSEVEAFYEPMQGRAPAFYGGSGMPAVWDILFQNADSGGPLNRGLLLGALDVETGNVVTIVATPVDSATEYQIDGVVTRWRGEPGGMRVSLTVPGPTWRKTTTTTSNALDAYNPSFVTDLAHWASANTTVGLTVSVTHDAAIFHDAAGSQSVDITANSAGVNALTDRFNTNFLPAIAGQTYTITTSARRTSLNVTPQQFVVWYDAALALISLTALDSFTAAVDTWERRTLVEVAPGGTAFARVFSRVLIPGAGNLGRVWFDDIVVAPRIVSSGDSFTVTNPGHAHGWSMPASMYRHG